MHEIIIKIIDKEEGEQRYISKEISDLMDKLGGELKISSKEETYSNEIWQIGEKSVDPKTWKVKVDELSERAKKTLGLK